MQRLGGVGMGGSVCVRGRLHLHPRTFLVAPPFTGFGKPCVTRPATTHSSTSCAPGKHTACSNPAHCTPMIQQTLRDPGKSSVTFSATCPVPSCYLVEPTAASGAHLPGILCSILVRIHCPLVLLVGGVGVLLRRAALCTDGAPCYVLGVLLSGPLAGVLHGSV